MLQTKLYLALMGNSIVLKDVIGTFQQVQQSVVDFCQQLFVIVSVCILAINGISYIFNQGDSQAAKNLKNTIIAVIIGGVLIYGAPAIVSFIQTAVQAG